MVGKTSTYERYLKSIEWWFRADAARQRAGNHCECCGSPPPHQGNLDVHHLTYIRLGQEVPEDLQALCRSCHESIHLEQGLLQQWREEEKHKTLLLREWEKENPEASCWQTFYCPLCGRHLEPGADPRIYGPCGYCHREILLELVQQRGCLHCGKIMEDASAYYCRRCQENPPKVFVPSEEAQKAMWHRLVEKYRQEDQVRLADHYQKLIDEASPGERARSRIP